MTGDSPPGAGGAGPATLGTSRYRFRHATPISTTKRPDLMSRTMPKLVDTSAPRPPTSGTATEGGELATISGHRGLDREVKLIFETGRTGKCGVDLPEPEGPMTAV